jgi:uncharacterized RDD family membrane protein YckC/uncharacterized Zn finger protein (UPF0148 family)
MVAPDSVQGMPVECPTCGQQTVVPKRNDSGPSGTQRPEPHSRQFQLPSDRQESGWPQPTPLNPVTSPSKYPQRFPAPAPQETTAQGHTTHHQCPICEAALAGKTYQLYGHIVCRSCYVSHAYRRQFAFMVDYFFIAICGWVGLFIVGIFIGAFFPPRGAGVADTGLLLAEALTWLSLPLLALLIALKDGFSGYSIGKAIFGIRVIDSETGEPAGFVRSIKRNLAIGVASVFCVLLPALIVGIDLKKGKRLGDGWAGTKVVVWKHRLKEPFRASIHDIW